MKTKDRLEQEKYELRIINGDLDRQQAVEELKKKHRISGTIIEQKESVFEKRNEVEGEIARIDEAEKNAKDILDQQATQESEA